MYNYSGISITDNDLTNNIGYVKRWALTDLDKLTRIGTWIPEIGKNDTIPAFRDLTKNWSPETYNSTDFVIYKFSGCTANTQIATMYITTSISI